MFVIVDKVNENEITGNNDVKYLNSSCEVKFLKEEQNNGLLVIKRYDTIDKLTLLLDELLLNYDFKVILIECNLLNINKIKDIINFYKIPFICY